MNRKKIYAVIIGMSIIATSAIMGPSRLVHAEGVSKIQKTVSVDNQTNEVVKAVNLKTGKVVETENVSKGQVFNVIFHGYGHSTRYNDYKLQPLKNQAYFHSKLQENLYNYLLSSNNRWKIEKNAIELHGGNKDNNCAYFVSTALNWMGAGIPYTGYTGNLRNELANRGWAKMTNIEQLRAGDICFSGNTHVYIFMGWANQDEGIAWIVDSQYGWFGNNAHVRSTWQDGDIDRLTDFWGGPTANVHKTNVNTNENAGIDCKSYNVGETERWTRVYSKPSYNSSVIGSFGSDELIQILASSSEFWKVNYNGGVGYIPKDEVSGSGPKYPNNITITNPEYTSKQYPAIGTGTINQYTWAMPNSNWNGSNVTTFNNGQAVTITGYNNGWYRVNYQKGSVWVPSDRINTVIRGKQYKKIGSGLVNNLNSNSVWVMSTNSNNGTHLGKLNNGTSVTITGESGDWYRINYMQTSGWVKKNTLDNPANYKVTPLNENGIINFNLGYTYAKNIPTWYGYETYRLNNGTKVNITGESGDWYRLNVNGKIEWVLKERVQTYEIMGAGMVEFHSYGGSCITNGPSWTSGIKGYVPDDTALTVTQEKNDWFQVIMPNGQLGWLPRTRFVTNLNNSIMAGVGTTNVYTNIQKQPNWTGGTIATVPKGSYMNIKSEKDGWFEVYFGDNEGTGWIEANRMDSSLNKNMKTISTGYIDFSGYTCLTYGPSWSSDLAGTLNDGAKVQIVGNANGWTRINYKNTTAWVPSYRIKTYNKIGEGTTNVYTYLQNNPSWEGPNVGVVNKGETLNIISEKNGWYEVEYSNGIGWVEGNRLNTSLNKNMNEIKRGVINFNNYTYVTYGPAWNCDRAGELKDGTPVEIVGEANGWYRINYGKSTAWVLKNRVIV